MTTGKRLLLKIEVKILHKLVKTKRYSRPKEPTRVSARVVARIASEAAMRLSIKGVVAGAAVEEIQASESASTLKNNKQ